MGNINVPLVSICIPTFNGEKFIAEAMDSAITQTYPNLEIIVSDDASQDATLVIVESFKSKTSIPITIYHHKPKGIGANWNYCVTKTSGDYIKFLFQDDVLKSNTIETMMDMALKKPKVGLVYCKRSFLIEGTPEKFSDFISYYGSLHKYWDSFLPTNGVISGRVYLKDKQLLNTPKNKIGEPTCVLLKKECFEKIGYFNEVLKQTLDYEYWYRVMSHYNIGFIDSTLVKFRLHQNQASMLNKKKEVKEGQLLYKSYYDKLLWYLHPKSQLKLLKLYHPVFKTLLKIKQKFQFN